MERQRSTQVEKEMDIIRICQETNINLLDCDYTKIRDHWRGPPSHADAFSRLYFVTKGSGALTYQGQKHILVANRLYLVPGNRLFQLHHSPGMGHYWLHFTAALLGGINLFSIINPPFSIIPDNPRELVPLLEAMYILWHSGRPECLLRIQGICRILLSYFFESRSAVWTNHSFGYHRFRDVLLRIENNLAQRFSVDQLAGSMGLNPNYFSDLFTQKIGCSPLEYMIRRRIEKAQLLLWQTEEPIKAVAAQVGYDDEAYFSRLFKLKTGMSPSQYRNRRVMYSF